MWDNINDEKIFTELNQKETENPYERFKTAVIKATQTLYLTLVTHMIFVQQK